ncbi:MAG: class I tRNA ligase family protein [Candidatus Pacebacteria bacterium]|nr:class I tRNA ligase family protein [Candidatus Paceibacterota bacterium]
METNTNKKSEQALKEEKILTFWKENKMFEKSLKKNSPKGHYVFYDGPPFATGQMHYGHILGSTAKDVVGRYKTMQGFYVPRKWGWDCHGLPIENIVEKELGIAGHKEIEALGIDKFVEYARSKVLQFDKDWEKGIERIGRWVDFKGSYKTMDNTFIESVWWALSELNKKNLIYEGVRVLAYCARCETPIANSEIAMDNSYKDIADISIYVKFELEDEPGTYLVAWTTTPWTLPGNTAIAVNKDVVYSKIKMDDEVYILAKDNLANVFKDKKYTVLEEMKGSNLVGKKYKPVFPYYKDAVMPNKENIYKVWHADFVTTEKGTGIAHEAPAFGEEDMVLAKANNIPWITHVDVQGRFVDAVTDFKGLKVKPKDTPEDKDAHLRTDIEIIKYLQDPKSNAYFDKEKIMHSYPHCMRCDTPIIYYALPSWFINITKEKGNIVREADSINWVPAHLKEGRFKNIVENAPDWNISRNRYWASPLPIWKCEKCKEKIFASSIQDLKDKTKKSGNTYTVMRHGESTHNLNWGISSYAKNTDKLTAHGKEQVLEAALKLKDKKIDLLIISPFLRTKETAEIVRKALGLSANDMVIDERLSELGVHSFEGKTWKEYHDVFPKTKEYFTSKRDGDESYQDVKRRVMQVLWDVENKYKNKNILFITHGSPAWLMSAGAHMFTMEETYQMIDDTNNSHLDDLPNAAIRDINFVPFPHNANYELDLHRPYIDEIEMVCKCGEIVNRIPEVLDCWFESGSMPFAQDHYPFENKNWKSNNFPAGFIAEYIAQTRTWFYYTHAVSTMLFGEAAFKNVVTTGTVRAEDGEKMSKSKNNYPDPWVFIDKYGVDALRLYLMSSPLMKGEDANFTEKSVQDIASKIIGRFYNVVAFYELYRDKNIENNIRSTSKNILDQWILARLEGILAETTKGMENYDMAEATRPIDLFIDELSTWYLRRSRDRIKDGEVEAKQTLYFILKTISKLLAPFAPFTAEDVWQKLKIEEDEESVHLAVWPSSGRTVLPGFLQKIFGTKTTVVDDMTKAREIVSALLKERQQKNIPVRQPLASATGPKVPDIYVEIIKDELNVREYNVGDFGLDINITVELKQEGDYRELVRALQDMRKKMGLTPSEVVTLSISTTPVGQKLVEKFETEIKKTVLVSKIEYRENDSEVIKIGDLAFKVKISK